MPISATEEPMALFGIFDDCRSVSLANKYDVRASLDAHLPPIPIRSVLPDGVQRTTEPLPLNRQAVAAMRCSRSVVTKIASASHRRKMCFSRRAAE